MFNLSVLLEDAAIKYKSSPALTYGDQSYTYEQFNRLSNQVANGLLKSGIKAGDKIAISCPNLPFFPIIYYGILKTGAIAVPLNVLLKANEIENHLRDSEAKAYFCYEGSADLPTGEYGYQAFNAVSACTDFFKLKAGSSPDLLFEDQPDTFDTYSGMEEDIAVIIYTSGTTGIPKGACLTHMNLYLNAQVARELFQSKHYESVLAVLPLFHIFGMTTMMNASVYQGLNIVLLPRFDAKTCFELIVKHHISIFAGVPTMYWALLNTVHDPLIETAVTKNLRLCVSGGAPLPVKIIQDFERLYEVPILEGYGMSEGSPIVSFNQIGQIRKQGSIGTPVWGVEVKIVDENDQEVPVLTKGELIFKGHNVMKEYYKNPEATAQVLKDGWMHSGDIAYKDEEGIYFIVDRSKDMIIRGGMNVYPRELEEIMLKHEAVSMAAVIGIPDEKFGEEIAAFIVLKPGKECTESEIIAWSKNQFASYKYPRQIHFMAQLPINASGKIVKAELRKLYK